MASKVELEIVTLLDKAAKDVAGFRNTTQKQLSSISFTSTVTAINQGFQLIKGAAQGAFGAVEGFIGSAIDEAVEGQQAMTQLANSMRVVGDFSEQAAADFADFASEIQKTTTFSDDAVLSAAALAKNYGLTNKETKNATQAAIEYAAATGSTLDEAISKVGKTFTGFVDRDLGRLLPQLKNLTKEQLATGEAARLIQERFAGSAAALGDTFQGSLTKTQNSFNDLLETIGNLIIENPVLIESIKIIGETFNGLTGEVDKNKGALGTFIAETVKAIAAIAPAVFQAAKAIDYVLSSVINLFRAVGTGLGGFGASIAAALEGNFSGARDVAKETIQDIGKIYGDTSKRLNGFYDPLIKSAQDASDKIQKIGLIDKNAKPIELKFNKSDAQITADRIKNAMLEGADKVQKNIEEAFNKQKELVGKIAANPFAAAFPEKKPGEAKLFTDKQEQGIATGVGALSGILGGAEGASKLAQSLGAGVADALVPGLGAAVGPIIGELAKGPEYVKQQIQEFAKAIPVIVKNIVLAIPVLIEELAKAVPQIVDELVDSLPLIVESLAAAMPKVAIALSLQMPKVAISFATSLIQNMPEIVKGFAKGFIDAAKQAGQALIDLIKDIPGDLFGGISGSGGGGIFEGIPVLGGIGDIFGFAEGGSIPDKPKYRGDKFGPAMLDGGEEILSKDLSNKLRQALDNGGLGGGQMPDINITLMAPTLEQWAKVSLRADQLNYRVRA